MKLGAKRRAEASGPRCCHGGREANIASLILKASLVFAISLGGCGAGPPSRSAQVRPLASEAERESSRLVRLELAQNDVGMRLFRRLVKDRPDHNVLISPVSLSSAMLMALLGARGQTAREMAKGLFVPESFLGDLEAQSKRYFSSLESRDAAVTFEIATAALHPSDVQVKEAYLDAVRRTFGAEVAAYNDPAEGVEHINAWVARKTRGMISEVLRELTGPALTLVSAAYFNGKWTTPFRESETSSRPFRTPRGEVSLPMMHANLRADYYGNGEFQAIALPAGQGGQYKMVVVLPNESGPGTEAPIDLSFQATIGRLVRSKVSLFLPHFKVSFDGNLTQPIGDLGLAAAFRPGADFSGIGRGAHLGQVLHRAIVAVNEAGTEAAATTVAGAVWAPPKQELEKVRVMEVNRPFYLAILSNGTLLFVGRIVNPLRDSLNLNTESTPGQRSFHPREQVD